MLRINKTGSQKSSPAANWTLCWYVIRHTFVLCVVTKCPLYCETWCEPHVIVESGHFLVGNWHTSTICTFVLTDPDAASLQANYLACRLSVSGSVEKKEVVRSQVNKNNLSISRNFFQKITSPINFFTSKWYKLKFCRKSVDQFLMYEK